MARRKQAEDFYGALRAKACPYVASEIIQLLSQVDRGRVASLSGKITAYIRKNVGRAVEKRNSLDSYRTNPYVLMATSRLLDLSDPQRFADFLFGSKLYMGLEGAFGKAVEAVAVGEYPLASAPDHKWRDPPEKLEEFATERGLNKEEKARKRVESVWRDIDKSCVVGKGRYLVSIKSGPNTINDDQVAAIHAAIAKNYPVWMEQTHSTYRSVQELDIVLGLTYGTPRTTNNKENQVLAKLKASGFVEENREERPGVLIDSTNSIRVYRVVGQDFWSFIGNPTSPEESRFVFLEVLVALARSLAQGIDEMRFPALVNRKIDELSRALQRLRFPRDGIPEWIQAAITEDEFLWLATAMTAFFDAETGPQTRLGGEES